MNARRDFMTKALTVSLVTATGIGMAAAGHAASGSKVPNTGENLMEAFSGESQANRKYTVFAKQAEKEGFLQVAKMFRAIGEAETIHASNELYFAGKVGNTMENLQTAIDGETYEYTVMYPTMMQTAQKEGRNEIAQYFGWAAAAEKDHAKMYTKALQAKGSIDNVDYFICEVCGYTHEGRPDSNCPICAASRQKFFAVS